MPIIKINGEEIERTLCTKILGVDIDHTLNFKKHVSKVCSKLAYCSHILTKLRGKVNLKILQTLYYAYANSILEYAISIWGCTAKYILHPLQVVQNSILRSMQYVPKYTNMKTVFKRLKILNIHSLYSYSACCYMYKALNNLCPKHINNMLIHKKSYKYATRHLNLLSKPQFTLDKATMCLSWKAPTLFNTLPNNIRNSSSLKSFKKNLKNHLLT